MFVDRVRIELYAGKGGDGCMSFRREKYVPKGGPDGGDGGSGASIILVAEHGVNSLAMFGNRKLIRAANGQPGQGSLRHGKNARDERFKVPPGTTIRDAERGFVLKDLVHPGDECVVARGGKGGHGNARYKSSTNQAPRERTLGEPGESRTVVLELRSIADVGLVGMPNAGKSTLLSRISSARPEIADYPFTTKFPNLGIVDVDAGGSFVLADIPGLIEGASGGVGLGYEFLRHIERAGLLVHLVEPQPTDESDPVDNYRKIRSELAEYDVTLADREELVVVTKCELPLADDVRERLAEAIGKPVASVSAVTGQGLEGLTRDVMRRVETRRQTLRDSGQQVLETRPSDDRFEARKRTRRKPPPHRVGLTSQLSNERQAKDFAEPAGEPTREPAGERVGDDRQEGETPREERS